MLKTALLGRVTEKYRSTVVQLWTAVLGSTHTRALPRLEALVETNPTFLVAAGTLKVSYPYALSEGAKHEEGSEPLQR